MRKSIGFDAKRLERVATIQKAEKRNSFKETTEILIDIGLDTIEKKLNLKKVKQNGKRKDNAAS